MIYVSDGGESEAVHMRGELSEGIGDGGHDSVTGQEVGRVVATVLG